MIVISDTSPIRALISIQKTKLLKELFGEIVIPIAVQDELLRIKSINRDIETFLKEDWITIKKVSDQKKLNDIKNYLDDGESEAIVLARELKSDLILMDESKGRKVAKTLEIEVLGLIGVLILAKNKHLIEAVKPHLDDLRNNYGFWIDEKFYKKILRAINE